MRLWHYQDGTNIKLEHRRHSAREIRPAGKRRGQRRVRQHRTHVVGSAGSLDGLTRLGQLALFPPLGLAFGFATLGSTDSGHTHVLLVAAPLAEYRVAADARVLCAVLEALLRALLLAGGNTPTRRLLSGVAQRERQCLMEDAESTGRSFAF